MKIKIKSILTLMAVIAMGSMLTGCVQLVKEVGKGKLTASVTTTTVGLRIAKATANDSPEVTFGYHRDTVVLEPNSTNGPIFAPNYANTFAFDKSGLLSFGLDESVASGSYQTAKPGETNSLSSQPIIPK